MSKQETERMGIDVRLVCEAAGATGTGRLHFGGDRWANVSLSDFRGASATFADECKYEVVKAFTEGGQTFSLCVCEVKGSSLFVDYVIEGDIDSSEFENIIVRYHDLSEWFLHLQKIDGEVGESLTWDRVPKSVDVTIKTDTEHFALRSEIKGSRRRQGEDVILHEHVEFVFVAKDRPFNLSDLKTRSHELSSFFSILMLHPVTIAEIRVSNGADDGFRVHFPTTPRPERDFQDLGFSRKSFVQQPWLDGMWQSMLDLYYRSQFRTVVWNRVAGMFRYEGFWEYELLGYVSLLDSYLNIRFKGASVLEAPAGKKVARFRRALEDEFSILTPAQRERIVQIATTSFSSDKDTFSTRYRQAVQVIDSGIKKIINISDEDFKFILKIRNRVAHGDDHGIVGSDFSRVIRVQSKISLLLLYFVFSDLGVDSKKFANWLGWTRNELRLRAAPDEIHLSRVNGTAEFFAVTEAKLASLRAVKALQINGCCIKYANGELEFSEDLTEHYAAHRRERTKLPIKLTSEAIFGLRPEDARCVGQGYFECGEDRMSVVGMWVVEHHALALVPLTKSKIEFADDDGRSASQTLN
jgi:hypothetical protein